MPSSARRGIVLLLTAGLIMMIGLTGLVFLRISVFSRARGESAAQAARAHLAACGGLEYAAARLWADPAALRDIGILSSVANRGDDWTSRGSEPPQASPSRLSNPSYAHGEPWIDAPPADGVFVPGPGPGMDSPAPGGDLDGDGRFDACSGRLRGSSGAFDNRFALRIRSAGGAVCVNSGELGSPDGDHDLDGILNDDDIAASATSGAYGPDLDGAYGDQDGDGIANGWDPDYAGPIGNGVPDWRDPAFIGNLHLVNLLDNLGAVLDLSIQQAGVPYSPLPGHGALGTIETSTLGDLVVANRPRGGYASVEELRGVLTPADFEKAAPYLAARGRVVPVVFPLDIPLLAGGAALRLAVDPESRCEFHALIDFNRASVEVLAASLRHLTVSGTWDVNLDPPPGSPFLRIGEAEADGIAAALVASRPVHSWRDFLSTLHLSCSPFFQDDPYTKIDAVTGVVINEKTDPVLVRMKEDLILAQAAPGGYAVDHHTWRANALEVVREAFPFAGIDATTIRMVAKEFLAGPLDTFPYDAAGDRPSPYDPAFSLTGIPSRLTTEYLLAPAGNTDFSVISEGWEEGAGRMPDASALVRAELSLADGWIELSGQQAFEMHGTVERPVGASSPWHWPGGLVRAEGPAQGGAGMETFPKFNLDSYHYTGLGPIQPWMAMHDRYPRAAGGLRLQPPQLTVDQLTDDPATSNTCIFGLPFNADRLLAPGVPEPGTWYATPNARQWKDNVGDPVEGPVAGSRRSPDPDDTGPAIPPNQIAHLVHEGCCFGSAGPRYGYAPAVYAGEIHFVWDGIAYPVPSAIVMPSGRFKDFTLAAWYPAGREEKHPIGGVAHSIKLDYRRDNLAFTPFLKTCFTLGETVVMIDPQLASNTVGAPWWLSDPAMRTTGWHHIALTVDPTGDNVTYYLDGVDVGTWPIGLLPSLPSTPLEMRLVLSGIFDDLRIFHPPLPASAVEALAREHRYAAGTATFTTPRYLFDAARFPAGAAARGIVWDGFVPAQTGGSFAFTVTGRDNAGAPLPVTPTSPSWNGSGTQSYAFTLSGCRSVEIQVETRTSPQPLPLNPPGPGGGPFPALRDTPELRWLAIAYGDRPRWSALSFR